MSTTLADNIKAAKQKLRQAIERKVFEFNDRKVKEQVIDFTVLYLRRNNIPHDSEQLAKIFDVFRMGVDDAYFKNIDILMNQIDSDINTFAETVDPLDSTNTQSSSGTKVLAEVRVSAEPKASKGAGKASKTSKSR